LNGDGKTNSSDYSILKRYLLEVIDSIPAEDPRVADLNLDGKVNSIDYSILRKYILGLITELPLKK